jgi:LysR family transcriptional regulator (chromosome initiation inhibitor)
VRVAVNADSLATWFIAAASAFATQEEGALLDLTVDDQDHTAERLRSGAVLAAVTALAQPVAGCNSEALGTMHYVAAASPEFVNRHFGKKGVGARTLASAPSLVFDRKDRLQARWVRRICHRNASRRRGTGCPRPRRFVEAALCRHGLGHAPGQHGGRCHARRARWSSWCPARRCRCRSTGSRRARRRSLLKNAGCSGARGRCTSGPHALR